ncbi:MAG: L-glutamate gamma-semialdehyde dehydrogenase [Firmicutes bacterium]|nr:L-glutamate gamma-semialdehyde dehydrogenase [Bacillota bacterium]
MTGELPPLDAGRVDTGRVEQETRRIGRELFDRVTRDSAGFFQSERWTGQLLEWSMRHQDARLVLFRFVDVLPALSDPEDVVRHLREYFRDKPDPFGGLLKTGLRVAGMGRLGAAAAAAALRKGVEQVARSFIAGTDPQEVLRAVEGFRRQGQGFTVDVLGEATLSEAEADAYQRRYLELLESLTDRAASWSPVEQADTAPWGPLPRVNVSVKLSALYSQLDPIDPETSAHAVMARLRPIVRLAKERGAHIHIDMEDYHLKDLTLHIFRKIAGDPEFRDYRHLGIVLQAYLKETERDAQELIDWAKRRGTPVTVRLVKGAYWDFETVHARLEGWPMPVYERKWETDAAFERLTRLFLENRGHIDLAIGSHNIRSIAHAMALAREMGLPPRTIEYQFLYGMAAPLRRALTERGERVRVYTPYGQLIPGMAYLVRRLLENTANESFLRRGFAEGESPEVLLRNPQDAGRAEESNGGQEAASSSSLDRAPAASPAVSPESRWYGGFGSGPEFGLPPYHNEPHADFSRADARRRMHEAIERVRQTLGGRHPLLIGDDLVSTDDEIVSVNPSKPSEIIGYAARARALHAERAVAAALRAFPSWRDTPAEKRVEILRQAADIMRKRRFELAALICLESGKPWREADGDVTEAIDFIEWYTREALRLAKPARMANLAGEINHYLYEPRGVAAVIAPWNFPLAILTGMSSAALAAGNAVVLKPAEQTPVIASKLVEIYREAGMPAGVVNYLPGYGEEAGAALVAHPDVSTIVFTGSLVVGLRILKEAAQVRYGQRHIKQVVTEMGGKNAVIVDDDADLDEAVAGVVASAFGYAGQKCSAASRAIVLERIYGAFLERLVEAARSLVIGPAWEPATYVGPVIDEEAQRRILGYIDKGLREGRPALVHEPPERARQLGGYYVPVVILADVPPDSVLACEEIFGPVLSVIRARDFDEALHIANDIEYKLTGGLFSRSPDRIRRARQQFRVGNLYINRKITGSLVGRQPFGGLGLSGTGFQAGGPDYLKQFVETRVVTENTLRRGFADDVAPDGAT